MYINICLDIYISTQPSDATDVRVTSILVRTINCLAF